MPAQERTAPPARLRRLISRRARRKRVELVEAALATGGALPLHRATPYQWATVCHDLWAGGRIDIVEFAVRRLHKHYPELSYYETLVGLFDGLPQDLPAPLAFCDDPAAEIQVVPRSGSEAVLLCFCAQQDTLGLPVNFVHQWLGRLPASLVYIRDLRDLAGACGYPTLGPDRPSACAALRRIVQELGGERRYAFGASIGVFPALYYGLALEAVAILALAGPTDLTVGFADRLGPVGPARTEIRKIAPDYAINLRETYASTPHKPRVVIAYGAGNPEDRSQAERMAGLPNMELLAVDYGQHNVIEPLIRQGAFMPLLRRLLADELASEPAAG
jgi:hypothetical protein